MWVSSRLVWDCTLLGKTRDVSALGLLEAIRQKFVPPERIAGIDEDGFGKNKRDIGGKSKAVDSFSVYEFMLGRNGKNTTPGLWGLYLAAAAFPIFGFGQWFLNPKSSGLSIYFLFAVYLWSGLGLLMVTSLLGMKRYVNKRGVSIPEAVAMNWLFVGPLFLIGLLLAFSILPRPDISSTVNDYLAFLRREKETSELAIGDDNDIPVQPDLDQNVKPKRYPQIEQDGDLRSENKQELEKTPTINPTDNLTRVPKQRPAVPQTPRFKPDSRGLRWTAYGLVALIFLAIILLTLGKLLRIWEQLFGESKLDNEVNSSVTVTKIADVPGPFSSFSDPFASGMPEKYLLRS